MNAIAQGVVDAHGTAQAAVETITAPLPLIVKVPVAILVWVVAFVRTIIVGLLGIAVTLMAVALAAHGIFNQGKSGLELAQNWYQVLQQNLTGPQLGSAIAATGLATAVWLYKSTGTLGKIQHIVNKTGYVLGFSKEDPEIADLKIAAARHGYHRRADRHDDGWARASSHVNYSGRYRIRYRPPAFWS